MQTVIQTIEKELDGLYPKTEIKALTRLIIEFVCGLNNTQLILRKNETVGSSEKEKIAGIVQRLKKFEPLQYILGEIEFYGLKLKVGPSVLIPRPETEELVQWIVETNTLKAPQILDIGTGSGCIALALKRNIPKATVTAVDISFETLETARRNSSLNGLEVHFLRADILTWETVLWKTYDIIVSNPPYVREMEKAKMQPNVLGYEPGIALFVPDTDPLVFYRRIAEFATKKLKNNGLLFFEINEELGSETVQLLNTLRFSNIQIKNDLRGKNRMLRCNT